MNEEDLEIAKEIAEIEGELDKFNKLKHYGNIPQSTKLEEVYNPFDWSILGVLMVKYGISPYFNSDGSGRVGRCREDLGFAMPLNGSIFFDSKEEIPLAILECIIKSKEK